MPGTYQQQVKGNCRQTPRQAPQLQSQSILRRKSAELSDLRQDKESFTESNHLGSKTKKGLSSYQQSVDF